MLGNETLCPKMNYQMKSCEERSHCAVSLSMTLKKPLQPKMLCMALGTQLQKESEG